LLGVTIGRIWPPNGCRQHPGALFCKVEVVASARRAGALDQPSVAGRP
jgi:hypothetical protein